MSILEWLMSIWFWILAVVVVLSLILVWWTERQDEYHYCRECLSGKRSVRNPMKYYMSDHLYTIQRCENKWHEKRWWKK